MCETPAENTRFAETKTTSATPSALPPADLAGDLACKLSALALDLEVTQRKLDELEAHLLGAMADQWAATEKAQQELYGQAFERLGW